MPSNPDTKVNELLVGRKIDQEFLSNLEIIHDYVSEKGSETACPATPGCITINPGDPRINVSQPSDMIVMARTLATIKHRASGRVFVIYRDTIDALYMQSQDLIKYPKWMMESEQKQNERSFRVNEMLRKPNDKFDSDWLSGDTIDDTTYDTLAYFLYLNRPSK